MKNTLLPAALLLTLASCGGVQSSAPVVVPEVAAATAFADSLAHVPHADRTDIRAATRYAQAVGEWYGSSLAADVKRQPLAGQVWGQYRAVLRTVVASRELSFQHKIPTDNLTGYAEQCAQLSKGILHLADFNPQPNAGQSQSDVKNASDGLLNVQAAASRHLAYLRGLKPAAKPALATLDNKYVVR